MQQLKYIINFNKSKPSATLSQVIQRPLTITPQERLNYTFNQKNLSKYQSAINSAAQQFPNVGPRYLATLLEKESSMGQAGNTPSYKKKFAGGENGYGWLTGFTKNTYNEIMKNKKQYSSIYPYLKFNTPQDAITATAAFSNYLAKEPNGQYQPIADKIYLKYNGKPVHQTEFRKIYNVNYGQ